MKKTSTEPRTKQDLNQDNCHSGEVNCSRFNNLLNPKQVSRKLNLSTSFLANQRWMGTGLNYVKIGGRVFYKDVDVDSYVEDHTVNTTK